MANAKLTPVMLKVLRWMATGDDLEYQLRYTWLPCYSVGHRPVRWQTFEALRVRRMIEQVGTGLDMMRRARYRLTEAGKAAASG